MDIKAIGEKIKQHRKMEGLTQEELGKKAGLSTMSIRRYENGDRIAPKETLQAIATALKITPFSLIGPEWWDIEMGPEKAEKLHRAVAMERGIIAMLEEIYGTVESKEVFSEHCGGEGHYYLVGKAPNTFILYDGDINALEQATKASIPALVERMKDSRPEDEVIREYQKEIEEQASQQNK